MTQLAHRQRYRMNLEVHRLDPGSAYTVEGSITVCKKCHGPLPRSRVDSEFGVCVRLYKTHYLLAQAAADQRGISLTDYLADLIVFSAPE